MTAINYESLKKLKDKVLNCLEQYPDTRNSDIKLANAIWIKFYGDYIFKADDSYAIKVIDLYKIPTQDQISRVRRKIQESGLFPPTDPEVAKKRGWQEEEWRKFVGANPELRKVYENTEQ